MRLPLSTTSPHLTPMSLHPPPLPPVTHTLTPTQIPPYPLTPTPLSPTHSSIPIHILPSYVLTCIYPHCSPPHLYTYPHILIPLHLHVCTHTLSVSIHVPHCTLTPTTYKCMLPRPSLPLYIYIFSHTIRIPLPPPQTGGCGLYTYIVVQHVP